MRGAIFTVSVVPYTLEHTIFGDYRPGRRVHLETDVLAKYVQSALAGQARSRGLAAWLTEQETETSS
jgi:riboflavin synthase